MEIRRGDTVIRDVYLRDNSYTVEEVMGEHTLTLSFLSRDTVDLRINDYIDFGGTRYKIRHNEKVTKRETSLGYEYNVVFYSSRYDLQDVQFFLHGTPERKKNFDYYTGTARDWLNLLVKNMNRTDTGWIAGSCINSRMITLSFKDKKVGSVLDELIKELDSEYWISGKTINIGKREYASNGLVLGQGEGMGFTELEVSAVDDTPPVTVLYPYGSDKNLGTDYGSDYLLLPGGVLSLEKNVEKYGRIEQSVQFEHIFPKGEFVVTEKIDNYTLKASGIDFNLTDCLLDGVEVFVTFQDGGLAGYDLAIVEGSWDNSLRQFKLKVNEQENALKVPGDINFSVGDKFILTGLKMPQSYRDNASLKLQEEAQAWLDGKCEKRIQLRGKCDEVVFRLQNLFISCGQMVGVYSEQLDIDREIRVTRVKRYLENDNKPCYRYELTLSDFLQSNGFKDMVDNVSKMPEEIEDKVRPVREHTKRSWRDVMETLGMMFDPEGNYFTELIKPLAVHTAQLIVGTNSQQMDLIGVRFIPNADNDANYFKNTAGKLVHFTVSETGVREWSIPAASFRLNNSLSYYVYAKCPVSGGSGSILVSERQIKLEDETGHYHFWVGVLNTPEDNVRSWNPNHGYTEIAGQTITTGVIKDKLARLVIDLINGTITGPVTFKAGSSGLDNVKEWPVAKKAIEDAQSTADDAVREIGETGKALSGFEETVNGAFKDGIIETAEAKAIEKYINTLNTEKADADAVYNKLYANAYLTGTAKTDLLNAKVTYNGGHTDLIKAVNTAIADGRTTAAEKKNVDSKFTAYKNALGDYKARVEAANKAIQDMLKGYSDSALEKGKEALTAAGNAQTSADNAKKSVTTLNTYVDGAFKDGVITEAEAKAIEKYLNTVKASKAEVEATYNKLYANTYLSGTAKTGLLNAKVTLFGAIDNLLSSINTAIADGKTTVAEKNDVDSKFAAFNDALSSFNTAVEVANKAMQDTLKGYSDTALQKGQDALSKAESASDAANSAQGAAGNAQSSADSKAKVFYSPTAPSSGMRTNDLWVDGTSIWRYDGGRWVFASTYDNTLTEINGGLVSTGAIAFGSTGGMAASGTVRIWSGGNSGANGEPPASPTFKVLSDGKVYGSNSIMCMNRNNEVSCGFASDGNSGGNISNLNPGSVRIWVGSTYEQRDSAPFRVGLSGLVAATGLMFSKQHYTYNGALAIHNDGQVTLRSTDTDNNGSYLRKVIMQTTPNYSNPVLDMTDIFSSAEAMNVPAVLALRCGRSAYTNYPRKWIDCTHAAGWGSNFRVESRYFSDKDSMERTVINVGQFMNNVQLQSLASNQDLYPVYVDINSGYLCTKIN